jgi:hypothetical protein
MQLAIRAIVLMEVGIEAAQRYVKGVRGSDLFVEQARHTSKEGWCRVPT